MMRTVNFLGHRPSDCTSEKPSSPSPSPSTEPPMTSPSTEPPTSSTSTEQPMSSTSTEAPTMSTSTEAPMTSKSTEQPIASTSTEPPMSSTSTEGPTTSTEGPTTSTSKPNPRPCAACKAQRRKCLPECLFAPHFPPESMEKFERVHSVYGSSNVAKILQQVQPEDRDATVDSLVYEASHRLNDIVYGVAGPIYFLQQRLRQLDKAFQSDSEYLAGLPLPPSQPENQDHDLDQYLQILIPDDNPLSAFSADPRQFYQNPVSVLSANPPPDQDYHPQQYYQTPVSVFSAEPQQQPPPPHQYCQNGFPDNTAFSADQYYQNGFPDNTIFSADQYYQIHSADPRQQPLPLPQYHHQIPGNNPVSVYAAEPQQQPPPPHQNHHHENQLENVQAAGDHAYDFADAVPAGEPDDFADAEDAYAHLFGGVDEDIASLLKSLP